MPPVEQIGPVIQLQTVADLASLPTAPLIVGQQAYVLASSANGVPGFYVLRPAFGGYVPDGTWICGTFDDATKVWEAAVLGSSPGAVVTFTTPEIDLTAVQNVVIVPRLPYKFDIVTTLRVCITQTNTPTANMTASAGCTGPSYIDVAPAGSVAGLITQAVDTIVFTPVAGSPTQNIDTNARGPLTIRISVGATAAALKGKFQLGAMLTWQ